MSNVGGAINQGKVALYAETSLNVFTLIGGQLSHSHSRSRKVVDITNGSLGDSRILLSQAGAKDTDISGEVLFSSDSAYLFMKGAYESGDFVNMLIKYDATPLNPLEKVPYMVTAIGESASLSGALTSSLTMQGVNTSVNAAPPANIPPVANFTNTSDGFEATFTDTSTDVDGFITTWAWGFDDMGATSPLQNPVYTFSGAGTYNVSLTVTDNAGGMDTIIKPVTVSAANIPPVANFTFVDNALEVTFTDTSTDSDGTITDWFWDFGD